MLGLRQAAFVLALLLALVGDSAARSHRTSTIKSHHNQTQSQQQIATPDQRGTEQQPLIVQPLTTKKNAEETSRDTREAEQKSNSDWWTWFLSVLTLGVLFIQALILAAQAYFMRATTAVMVALENPNPTVVSIKLVGYTDEADQIGTGDHVAGPFPDFSRILVLLQNLGRSHMRMEESSFDWVIVPALPEHPAYTHVVSTGGSLFQPGRPIWLMDNRPLLGIRLTENQRQQMQNGDAHFFAYGYFVYRNLVGDRFALGFLARWDMAQGFVRDPDQSSNYEYFRLD